MLIPKRTKFRKPHRVSYEGLAKGKNLIIHGDFALVALQGNWITERQIEAARIAITKHMKRLGKLWINIFPHMGITRKPLAVRMGSGKGSPDHFVAVVKKNKVMFEVNGVSEEVAKRALKLASYKLPIKCKVVKKSIINEN